MPRFIEKVAKKAGEKLGRCLQSVATCYNQRPRFIKSGQIFTAFLFLFSMILKKATAFFTQSVLPRFRDDKNTLPDQ